MSEQTTPLLRERGVCEHCAGENHKAHTKTYVQAGVEYPCHCPCTVGTILPDPPRPQHSP